MLYRGKATSQNKISFVWIENDILLNCAAQLIRERTQTMIIMIEYIYLFSTQKNSLECNELGHAKWERMNYIFSPIAGRVHRVKQWVRKDSARQ